MNNVHDYVIISDNTDNVNCSNYPPFAKIASGKGKRNKKIISSFYDKTFNFLTNGRIFIVGNKANEDVELTFNFVESNIIINLLNLHNY